MLRLVNPGDEEAEATVTGTDDAGLSPGSPGGPDAARGHGVPWWTPRSWSPGRASPAERRRTASATAPASGGSRWNRTHSGSMAMSLLSSPGGHLANLSGKASAGLGGPVARAPVPGGVRPARVGRASCGRSTAASLSPHGHGAGVRRLRHALRRSAAGARTSGQTVHFDSDDLELGNRTKGLTGSTGAGTGTWRLTMYGRRARRTPTCARRTASWRP